jgi:hypothetical protein
VNNKFLCRHMLAYVEANDCSKLHNLIWAIGLFRNFDRNTLFEKLPEDLRKLPEDDTHLTALISYVSQKLSHFLLAFITLT